MRRHKKPKLNKEHDKSQDHMTAGAAESHHHSEAAQAVFNTPELLEQILKHLPMDFLGRALSISKYCQNVILGSTDMRRTLFFEPAPAADFIETYGGVECVCSDFPACGHQQRVQWIDVKAHPSLRPAARFLGASFPPSFDGRTDYLPHYATHKTICTTLDNAPASALIFQPPPPEVQFFYIRKSVLMERSGVVTFGAIREELVRQRKESQDIIGSLTSKPEESMRLKAAMRVLDPSLETNFDSLYRDGPCVFLRVNVVAQSNVRYRSPSDPED